MWRQLTAVHLVWVLSPLAADGTCKCAYSSRTDDALFPSRQVVTTEAMGARCAVAGDLDGDGDFDLVSASSTDNTVAWYERFEDGSFSTKTQITFTSNGARIAATGDVNGDGHIDVIAASYYDHTVGWFANDGTGKFSGINIVSQTAINAQGVTVADIDGDGDLDIASASSGDNAVAWYRNLGVEGRFCEVKNLVDTNAVGVRTVVAGDFDGDGDLDLASASKDDNTVAWYPNSDGKGLFTEKRVINDQAMGAYSLVAVDVDRDGHVDLVVASNGDDTVAFYKNDGAGNFARNVIYDNADFVLSVYAADLDLDGDVDVASASFFDGTIRWYENTNGIGTQWADHTLYVGVQGHYVHGADLDADGDTDLIAVTHAENAVMVFMASTPCDNSTLAPRPECCSVGQFWSGNACQACGVGTYGVNSGVDATCEVCPANSCTIPGRTYLPPTCTRACNDPASEVAACDCGQNQFKDEGTDVCVMCPEGQEKELGSSRSLHDLGGDWPGFKVEGCVVTDKVIEADQTTLIVVLASLAGAFLLGVCAAGVIAGYRHLKNMIEISQLHEAAQVQRIADAEISTRTCLFNVCFINGKNFRKYNKMVIHEKAREDGKLVSLDTYMDVQVFVAEHKTVFFSHQWLSQKEPDPNRVHYAAMLEALDALCNKARVKADDLWIWMDYTSIPQENVYLKGLSIMSLCVYAAVVTYFVVIAPDTTHVDTGAPCNQDTYLTRGWCRAEQWARMTVGGVQKMYIAEKSTLIPITDMPLWYEASIKVFDGLFSDPSDKVLLVDMTLGLWAMALRKEMDGLDDEDEDDEEVAANSLKITQMVRDNKAAVFPPELFQDGIVDRLERQVREMSSAAVHRNSLVNMFSSQMTMKKTDTSSGASSSASEGEHCVSATISNKVSKLQEIQIGAGGPHSARGGTHLERRLSRGVS